VHESRAYNELRGNFNDRLFILTAVLKTVRIASVCFIGYAVGHLPGSVFHTTSDEW